MNWEFRYPFRNARGDPVLEVIGELVTLRVQIEPPLL